MVKIKVYSTKGEWVGDIDTDEKTYYTQRDFKQSQVFKYIRDNPLAIDLVVIRQLLSRNVKFIAILVSGLKHSSFYAVASLNFFLSNSERINYGNYGPQRKMVMHMWKQAATLDEVKSIRQKYNEELTNLVLY